MNETNDTSKQTILAGLGAIIATLLMASGQWSIFDFGISVSIIAFGVYFIRSHEIKPTSKAEILLFAFPFSLMSASALICLLSMIAYFVPTIAGIDSEIYQAVHTRAIFSKSDLLETKKVQVIWQSSIFLGVLIVWMIIFYFNSTLREFSIEDEIDELNLETEDEDGV